jgi:hypothetical protein
METKQRRVIFTAQDELDAQRLLQRLDERSKRPPAERAGQIRDQPQSTAGGADGEIDKGLCTIDRRPQHATPGGQSSDHVAGTGHGNGLVAGEVRYAGPVEPDDVTMRSPAYPNADSNRHLLTTGLEGPQSRAVRWGKK